MLKLLRNPPTEAADILSSRNQGVFLYSVQGCSPNGDPLKNDAPRQDPVTRRIQVSKYRIKRTVRDYLRDYENLALLADGSPQTIDERLKELLDHGGPEVLYQVIDFILFGAVINPQNKAIKESFPLSSFRGPVQVYDAESLHPVEFLEEQGISAFKGREHALQKSFRMAYKIPFALISAPYVASPALARYTGANDDTLDIFYDALWYGTDNLLTGTKLGHKSRGLLNFRFKDEFPNAMLPFPEKGIRVTFAEGIDKTSVRGIGDILIDFSEVWARAERFIGKLKEISLVLDADKDMHVEIGEMTPRMKKIFRLEYRGQ